MRKQRVDGRLRFRVWVAGTLVREDWAGAPYEMALIAGEHERIAREASEKGKGFTVEVYDPDKPEEEAYLRFGSDAAGMVTPVPVTAADLKAEARRRWPAP